MPRRTSGRRSTRLAPATTLQDQRRLTAAGASARRKRVTLIGDDFTINNVEKNNWAWITDTALTTKFWLNGIKGVGAFRVRATGIVTVTGAGISTNGTITADAGGVVRSLASDFATDISKLGTDHSRTVYTLGVRAQVKGLESDAKGVQPYTGLGVARPAQ